jgi:hypothetical protein
MKSGRSRDPCVEDVLITEALAVRRKREADYAIESGALTLLARQLAEDPAALPQRLAMLTLDLCHAHSAGITMYGRGASGDPLRFVAIRGPLSVCAGKFSAAADSFWATPLRGNAVMLFKTPARVFADLLEFEPAIFEALVVPCTKEGAAIGAIWAISHTPDKRFDAQDARLLRSMSPFVSAARQLEPAS